MKQESDLHNKSEKRGWQHVLLGRTALMIMLLMLGMCCFLTSCIIPKFADILRDLYEKHPLPALTQFVIGHASSYFWLSILLPIAGIGYLWRSKSLPRAIVASVTVITVLLLMCVTIVVAIGLPLRVIIESRGNVP